MTVYKFYEQEGQSAYYTVDRRADDERVFHIFGDEPQIAALHKQLYEENQQQREKDMQDRRRADELHEGVQRLKEQLEKDQFLQMQPIHGNESPILAKCWKCEEDNAVVLRQLAADFEKWESDTVAKAVRL